jgi:hypothetical protein
MRKHFLHIHKLLQAECYVSEINIKFYNENFKYFKHLLI